MTEAYNIQCENCGTIYPNTDEVCPYCGQPPPQPGPAYEDAVLSEQEYKDEFYPDEKAVLPAETHLPPGPELPLADEYAAEDLAGLPVPGLDGFPVARAEPDQDNDEDFDEYDETYVGDDDEYDELDDDYGEEELDEEEFEPRHRLWPRLLGGCLGILACIGLFYGGIGLFATYQGLQERTSAVQTEAEEHYQRGQEHLANNSIELAMAEFELALSLNPNLHLAREALHEAQRISQSLPTPTSETRLAAATALLSEAETQMAQENWPSAIEKLSQVRDLDPEYQVEKISDLLYQANYQLGLESITPDQIEEALHAFEQALAERPDDEVVRQQITRASLYLDGTTAVGQDDLPQAIKVFQQLYRQDGNYLDVKQQLLKAYATWGDQLAAQGDWCAAEAQYVEAIGLQPDENLRVKSENSHGRCREEAATAATGTSPAVKPPPTAGRSAPSDIDTSVTVTATTLSTTTVSAGQGKIFFSAFNPNEARWEILAVPAAGGSAEVVALNGTMPALSPNGRLLLYHSELIEAEGFHILDLTSGENNRITIFKHHILPRWGGDNEQFLFVAEEPGTQRWQIQLGFADGKSDPVVVRDGRTPDWSPDNRLIAYQGTDAEGNNPGLYVVPFNGGESTQLTNHESDRAPDFSPDGSQLAYMSTRNGNWDIYTISTVGSVPRQITTTPGQEGLPTWSPDGSQIAYVSDANGNWAIYVVDAGGGTPYRVIEWDGRNRPDWLLAQIWWAR
ncbi:MAG: PD40 domain-containing protein [Anaerolineae bacterium]|nr:PD40 domain-containing protein [Anaerolineae bacterium]